MRANLHKALQQGTCACSFHHLALMEGWCGGGGIISLSPVHGNSFEAHGSGTLSAPAAYGLGWSDRCWDQGAGRIGGDLRHSGRLGCGPRSWRGVSSLKLEVGAQARLAHLTGQRCVSVPSPFPRVSRGALRRRPRRRGQPSLASPGPHPTEAECQAGSLLQVATATPALGFPDLDSGAFVFQPFPVHHRLTPAA